MILPLTKTASLSPLLGAGVASVAQAAGSQIEALKQLRLTNPILYQALMAATVIEVLNRLTAQTAPPQPPPPEQQPHQWPLM